mgnify:CR=1 FL=1
MAANAAALRGITKQYKNFTLGPVDMTVPAGSIVGLIGENGAGKTTLLKILCGVNRADDGTVDLLVGSPADAATRAKIGVVFEDAFFYGSFTAAQVARSLAGMYGAQWNADSFSAYLRRFGLDAGKKLKEYSRGMRLKLSLAAALAHDPELLVLDEACAACKNDLVEEALLREAAARAEQGAEVVLTGREPAAWMQDAADYSTELRAVRHPYTRGIAAREGVEY